MMAAAGAQKASGWASTAASPCDGPKGSVNNGIAGILFACSAVFKPNVGCRAAGQPPSCTAMHFLAVPAQRSPCRHCSHPLWIE